MAPLISSTAAYAVVFGALGLFALTATFVVETVYRIRKDGNTPAGNAWNRNDFFFSARESQGWKSLGLSFFSSAMGAWVIFAVPEVGILSGWWGVLGYAVASTLPFLLLRSFGPVVREKFRKGFCLTDWVAERYGWPMQILVSVVSLFYMWVYLVAEFAAMGNLLVSFSGLDSLYALIPVAAITALYTIFLGLPASLVTDQLQGFLMVVLILVAIITCFVGLDVQPTNWATASAWDHRGFEAGVTLILGIVASELFSMGYWQRVYAAKDMRELRKGCLLGAFLILPTMLLFGVLGMLAKAQDVGRGAPRLEVPALAFFDLLLDQPQWVSIVAFVMAVCMVASSVDTLQAGMLSLLGGELRKFDLRKTTRVSMFFSQIFLFFANASAAALAAQATKDKSLNIIDLFLIADLLALSIVVPVFAGLGSFASPAGALCGSLSGFALILVWGFWEFGTFFGGLEMLTLMSIGVTQPETHGLRAPRTCILFFVLPVWTGTVTLAVSWMERMHKFLDQIVFMTGIKLSL